MGRFIARHRDGALIPRAPRDGAPLFPPGPFHAPDSCPSDVMCGCRLLHPLELGRGQGGRVTWAIIKCDVMIAANAVLDDVQSLRQPGLQVSSRKELRDLASDSPMRMPEISSWSSIIAKHVVEVVLPAMSTGPRVDRE